jgi:hypothetical protein
VASKHVMRDDFQQLAEREIAQLGNRLEHLHQAP